MAELRNPWTWVGVFAWQIPFTVMTGWTLLDWQWWPMLAGVFVTVAAYPSDKAGTAQREG